MVKKALNLVNYTLYSYRSVWKLHFERLLRNLRQFVINDKTRQKFGVYINHVIINAIESKVVRDLDPLFADSMIFLCLRIGWSHLFQDEILRVVRQSIPLEDDPKSLHSSSSAGVPSSLPAQNLIEEEVKIQTLLQATVAPSESVAALQKRNPQKTRHTLRELLMESVSAQGQQKTSGPMQNRLVMHLAMSNIVALFRLKGKEERDECYSVI